MSTEQNADQDNIDQIKCWNGDAGDKWVRFADRLDALLAPFAPLILERAALQTGERVLDIGCGGGALSLAAEEKIAPDGGVTGVDVSAPLLELARQRSANAGGNSAFVEADAAQYRSSIPLDAAVSRFGVMFFSDPAVAFSSLRRSFRPEARLVFVCWQGLGEVGHRRFERGAGPGVFRK
ncbi:MAG: methyltransferase domain-containing protein, partial [Pseudomonadota bacterium]